MATVSRRLGWGPRNFPSTAYQTLQGFPFRPSTEDSSTGRENVKFRSFEINSAPRDCATFTRLEYLASREIFPAFIKAFASLRRQSRDTHRIVANETGERISDFLAAVYPAFPFCCLMFSLHNATRGSFRCYRNSIAIIQQAFSDAVANQDDLSILRPLMSINARRFVIIIHEEWTTACAKYFAVERCFRPFCRRFVSLSVHFAELPLARKSRNTRKTWTPSFGHFNAKASCREHPGCLFSCFRIFSISLERFFAFLAARLVSSRLALPCSFFFSRQITDGSRTACEEEKSVETLRSSLYDPE